MSSSSFRARAVFAARSESMMMVSPRSRASTACLTAPMKFSGFQANTPNLATDEQLLHKFLTAKNTKASKGLHDETALPRITPIARIEELMQHY